MNRRRFYSTLTIVSKDGILGTLIASGKHMKNVDLPITARINLQEV